MSKKKKRHEETENALARRSNTSIDKNKKRLRRAKVRKYKLLHENFSPHAWAAILLAFDVVPLEQIEHVIIAEPSVAIDVIAQLKIREIEISTVGINVIRDA